MERGGERRGWREEERMAEGNGEGWKGKRGERLRDCPGKLILSLLFHIRIIFDTPRFFWLFLIYPR